MCEGRKMDVDLLMWLHRDRFGKIACQCTQKVTNDTNFKKYMQVCCTSEVRSSSTYNIFHIRGVQSFLVCELFSTDVLGDRMTTDFPFVNHCGKGIPLMVLLRDFLHATSHHKLRYLHIFSCSNGYQGLSRTFTIVSRGSSKTLFISLWNMLRYTRTTSSCSTVFGRSITCSSQVRA